MQTKDFRGLIEENNDGVDILNINELHDIFLSKKSMSKHVLTIYSMVIGLNAKNILDIGYGYSTRAILSALRYTGGKLTTIDFDYSRWQDKIHHNIPNWKFIIGPSAQVLSMSCFGPYDFIMHDGAHDYENVKNDLEILIPRLKQFGILCVHDTQFDTLGEQMRAAVIDACKDFNVSSTTLPYCCGFTIIRNEQDFGYGKIKCSFEHERGGYHDKPESLILKS